jgi:hypothetical protein
VQTRPLYVLKDYGKVKAKTVYIRHGSATAIADPDEIARMGAGRETSAPSLAPQFADLGDERLLGEKIELVGKFLHPFNPDSLRRRSISMTRAGYEADLVDYVFQQNLMQPVGIGIINHSPVPAREVRLTALIPSQSGVRVLDADHTPEEMPSRFTPPLIAGLANRHRVPFVSVKSSSEKWIVSARWDLIRPGETAFSDSSIYFGGYHDFDLKMDIQLLAETLRTPSRHALEVRYRLGENRDMTLDDFPKEGA